ncbi:MAG: hypothetical protein AAF492_05245 [Verrucomicrobiota bacterium]
MNDNLYIWLGRLRWGILLLAGVMALTYGLAGSRLPDVPDRPTVQAGHGPTWPEIKPVPAAHWEVFKPAGRAAPVADTPIAQRFRLAGTFFHYGNNTDSGTRNLRRAIVDDLQTGRQTEVQEGDRIDAYRVVQIFHDHLTLNKDDRMEELWLSHLTAKSGLRSNPGEAEVKTPPAEPEPLEVSRFGKRIDEQRWVMSRAAIEAYHDELRDDPERLAKVYLSMRPVYEGKVIEGYSLQMAGEEELFKAFGLQEGDIIRRVNSMRMTSQRRAEYLLGEFSNHNLNIFDFDVERNGENLQLIHMIR